MQQTYAAELSAAKARPCGDCGAAAYEDCGPDCLAGEAEITPEIAGDAAWPTFEAEAIDVKAHEAAALRAAISQSGMCEDCCYDAAAGLPTPHCWPKVGAFCYLSFN